MKKLAVLILVGAGLVLFGLFSQRTVSAHSVTVDGVDSDWLTGFGVNGCPNLPGIDSAGIYSDADGCTGATGSEYIWTDATGDQRIDHWNGTGNLDLTQFRMTADPTHLSFLLRFAEVTNCNAAYIAIAINTDDSGDTTYFPDNADTNLPFGYERVIEANTFTTGYWSDNSTYTSAGASYYSDANDLWEIRMPLADLGMTVPAQIGDYDFAVAIFCNDSGGICDVSGNSDAMDVITDYPVIPSGGMFSASGEAFSSINRIERNTWDEVWDGTLDFSFTTNYGIDGEPGATATPTERPTSTHMPEPPTPTPTSTNTPVPPTATNTPTNTHTPVVGEPPIPDDIVLFLSSNMAGSLGGVDYEDEDILYFDPYGGYYGLGSSPSEGRDYGFGQWALFFDGSAVGLAGFDVNAFEILPDYSILMSVQGPGLVPGIGRVEDKDIIWFIPDNMYSFGFFTSGRFELFLRGSDFGFAVGAADIDAMTVLSDGELLISVSGYLFTTSFSAGNQDLVMIDPGSNVLSLFFDGNANDLGEPFEHISAVSYLDGILFMSSQAKFDMPGLTGHGRDVYACLPVMARL